MKTILFLLISVSTYGQNAIIVHNVTKTQVIQTLFNNGYIIDKSDDNIITTEVKEVNNVHIKLVLNLRDSIVTLRGYDNMTFMGDADLIPVSRVSRGPIMKCWNEMNRIALLLGERVEYAKMD